MAKGEGIIVTPPANSKLRYEVCGGVTMRCFPIQCGCEE